MKRTIFWSLVALALALFAIGVWKGENVPLSQQQSILGSLQTAGAVVFGIVGAWVAIIYPKTYDWTLSKSLEIAKARERFFRSCTLPMKMSCAVFLLSIIIWPVVSVLGAGGLLQSDSAPVPPSQGMVPRIIFGMILVLVEIQALAILWSLRPTLDTEDILARSLNLRESGTLPGLRPLPPPGDGENE